MIFAVKSAFFALSGDSNEQNLDFDLPHAAESADLVKEPGALIKHSLYGLIIKILRLNCLLEST